MVDTGSVQGSSSLFSGTVVCGRIHRFCADLLPRGLGAIFVAHLSAVDQSDRFICPAQARDANLLSQRGGLITTLDGWQPGRAGRGDQCPGVQLTNPAIAIRYCRQPDLRAARFTLP